MIKLFDRLIDPGSKEKITINWLQNTIENLNQQEYDGRVVDGIPIILPKEKNTKTDSELHTIAGSKFNYIDHYIKDAEVFDYFQVADETTENERVRLNQFVISTIGSDKKALLDVGCGNGWLSKMIQDHECRLVSLDISFKNVKKVIHQQPRPNHAGIVADVFHLPFQSKTFDVIVASEIIEHVYDPRKFISCLLEVLNDNGKLIITTPYNEKIPYYLCVHCNKPTPRNAHLHSFDKKRISEIIEPLTHNFKIHTITNKHLLKIRVYWLLAFLPFKWWQVLDKIAVKILGNPTRLIIEINKQ